jgi:hypothetical protein
MIRHGNCGLLCVTQKSHIILNAKRPSLGSSELVFLFNRILDKDVYRPWEIVLEMFDLQIVCYNLFIAFMVNYWARKNSMMKSLWTRVTDILSLSRAQLVILTVEVL